MLAAPQFDRPFSLCVDASNVGAGAVLLQADDVGIHRPVSYCDEWGGAESRGNRARPVE